MSTLNASIVSSLATAREPLTRAALEHLLPDWNAREIAMALPALIRSGQIVRHHSPAGHSYSIAGSALPATAPDEPPNEPPAEPAPVGQRASRPAPGEPAAELARREELIVEALRRRGGRAKPAQIIADIGIDSGLVYYAFTRLRKAGRARLEGNTSATLWILATERKAAATTTRSEAAAAPEMSASLDSTTRRIREFVSGARTAPPDGDPVRQALESLAAGAHDALDAYLGSVLDPELYQRLRQACEVAESALNRYVVRSTLGAST